MCIDRVVSGGNLFCPSPTEFEKKGWIKRVKRGKEEKMGKREKNWQKCCILQKWEVKKSEALRHFFTPTPPKKDPSPNPLT